MMKIEMLDRKFGIDSKNLIDSAKDHNFEGALACLETFYYAFNNRDLATFLKVWLQHDLIQLNNPLGGILRGIGPINKMYEKIFNNRAQVWVELSDIVVYYLGDMALFAGKETGEFRIDGQIIDLHIRTTRFIGYSAKDHQWFQIHHHGSIDDAELLSRYQHAVNP